MNTSHATSVSLDSLGGSLAVPSGAASSGPHGRPSLLAAFRRSRPSPDWHDRNPEPVENFDDVGRGVHEGELLGSGAHRCRLGHRGQNSEPRCPGRAGQKPTRRFGENAGPVFSGS
jgi:hypothetical protein